MDEQEQAQQALVAMFRRDQTEVEAHPPRKPRWYHSSRGRAWLLAVALVIFVLAPSAFLVMYPRFGPVDTMTAFCQAVGDGEYETAYALLSKRAQQRVSLDAFTQASSNANLVSCNASQGIPLIFGGTQASLDATYQFVGGAALDGTMAFVREHGEWRVDSMSPDLFRFAS
ncbi:MAG TPA: hypothetical protein VFQ25_17430 [Ktedonobacterales bacterium]|nr:hypothetical protein [Ktedonobacterales bacterium]